MRKRKQLTNLLSNSMGEYNKQIDPDETFLDSRNLPSFDLSQMEGRLEKPIRKSTSYIMGVIFILVAAIFLFRVGYLQIERGAEYAALGEGNRLSHTEIIANRGIVFDVTGMEVVWNVPGETRDFASRAYMTSSSTSHILGYVSYPKTDSSGIYYETEYIGNDGVERMYDSVLNGENGTRVVETDALMSLVSANVLKRPINGSDVTLTIDSEMQRTMYTLIENLAADKGFESGAGVIMDIENGELLTMTSYPGFDPNIIAEGDDTDRITAYFTDPHKPLLNRAIAGLYTPGSIVKPFMALAALSEGVISPDKLIESTGSIRLQNPYNPELYSVFVDWKAHGWIDMRDAIAVSSNVYFYSIGGGFEGQKGLGIERIEKYMRSFGVGVATGIDLPGEVQGTIPTPEWKERVFDGEQWRIGDTYNTSIGQYGFQVTPLQMARSIGMIASKGVLVTPHVVKQSEVEKITSTIDTAHFNVIHEGMREGVLRGSAAGLNTPGIELAAKTGTAQVGISKSLHNSWIVGFFPYDEPKYSFAVVMERGPSKNVIGALFVMRQFVDWMKENRPEMVGMDES